MSLCLLWVTHSGFRTSKHAYDTKCCTNIDYDFESCWSWVQLEFDMNWSRWYNRPITGIHYLDCLWMLNRSYLLLLIITWYFLWIRLLPIELKQQFHLTMLDICNIHEEETGGMLFRCTTSSYHPQTFYMKTEISVPT